LAEVDGLAVRVLDGSDAVQAFGRLAALAEFDGLLGEQFSVAVVTRVQGFLARVEDDSTVLGSDELLCFKELALACSWV